MLLVIEGFDSLIVHNRFIESELSLLFNILFVTDVDTALHRRHLAVVGVEAEGHHHVEEVLGTTIKLKHAAEHEELDGHWREESQNEALRTLYRSYRPIDRKHCVFAARFVEVEVEVVQVREGIVGNAPDTSLNEVSNHVHTVLLGRRRDQTRQTKRTNTVP